MAQPNRFAEALRAVEHSRLRAAFEASSQADTKGGYDRTTLNRWLDGALPNRGEFVRLLADELDDPDLYDAWEDARGERSGSAQRSVVSRFEGLAGAEKDQAFHEIRRNYVSDGRPVRRNLVYRITVNDPPEAHADHLLLRLDMSWEGRLPANAELRFVTDESGLGDAYSLPDCIFRELLAFDPAQMADLFDTLADDQVLAYNTLGALNPRPVTHRARPDSTGSAVFDNAEVERAHIKLSLSYPIPKGTPMFLFKVGEYSVPGPAEASLTLNSRATSRPQAVAFLAPGRQREWAANQMRANELFISLGTAETVLGEGDGFVLSWTVS